MTRYVRYLIAAVIGLLACLLFVVTLRFFFEGVEAVSLFFEPFLVKNLHLKESVERPFDMPIFQWKSKAFILYIYLAGVVVLFARHLKFGSLLSHPFDGQSRLSLSIVSYTFWWFFVLSLIGLLSFVWNLIF